MQYKVPQDVLRPDKIVGFLTLRQLIIVAIGGGIDYSLYLILSKQYFIEIWLPPVLFITFITIAFAFVKFHDILFEKLILIFIEYKFRPRNRTFSKMRGDTLVSVLGAPLQKTPGARLETGQPLSDRDRKKKLEEITKLVDMHGKDLLSKNQSATLKPKP